MYVYSWLQGGAFRSVEDVVQHASSSSVDLLGSACQMARASF